MAARASGEICALVRVPASIGPGDDGAGAEQVVDSRAQRTGVWDSRRDASEVGRGQRPRGGRILAQAGENRPLLHGEPLGAGVAPPKGQHVGTSGRRDGHRCGETQNVDNDDDIACPCQNGQIFPTPTEADGEGTLLSDMHYANVTAEG